MVDLIYKEEVYAIVGAAMEVHAQLGCGFFEPVYQEALELELALRNIPFEAQQEIILLYKGHTLKKRYVADFVVMEKIIVEIKALDSLTTHDEAQLLNYLKATGMEVGLLLNFGAEQLERKRIVHTKKKAGGVRG
ncbi:MAG: GxxExxY protein [Chloroflexi bacterium]|nr:GxxExxY protein [Chloroflexota bacterium]